MAAEDEISHYEGDAAYGRQMRTSLRQTLTF